MKISPQRQRQQRDSERRPLAGEIGSAKQSQRANGREIHGMRSEAERRCREHDPRDHDCARAKKVFLVIAELRIVNVHVSLPSNRR